MTRHTHRHVSAGRALAFVSLSLVAGVSLSLAGLGGGAASAALAKSKSTTTTKPKTTTTTATSGTVVSAADTWLIKAIGAEQKVGSVIVNATEQQGKTKRTITLLVNGDGEGSGTFVQEGSLINMELVGPLLYFKAPKAYWASHSTAAQATQYGGKWIEVSALDSRFQAFDEFFNPEELVASVFQGHAKPLILSRPSTPFMGHKVAIVSESVTTAGKTSSGKMYIAATGKPQVLKIIDKAPGMSTTIVFSHYGKAVPITTPPEPINLT
ncbi:MAG TPA: hypothetical protein VGF87_06000 [Acidimicrobiales bacterium]